MLPTVSNGQIFLYELLGTATLVLLGCGTVATAALINSKGRPGGWLLIAFGWGLALYAGVYVAFPTGAHLNPAVTLALLVLGQVGLVPALFYVLGQFVGAMLGAVLCWYPFKDHFNVESDPAVKLGVFATGPAIRSLGPNLAAETLGTFLLVFLILISGGTPSAVGPLFVALILVAIGCGLGGTTGFALNPARDLGPRAVYAMLPIRGKGRADWSYAWIPVVGPLVGALIAAALFRVINAQSLIEQITPQLPR